MTVIVQQLTPVSNKFIA